MVEELTIVMEPLVDVEEIVVTVTKEAESLNPLVLPKSVSYEELKKKVLSVCAMEDVHMLYIDDEGDAISLDSQVEFTEAWKQAVITKQLHIMAQPSLQTPPIAPSNKPKHTNPYVQLAACISEDRKQRCERAGKSLLKEERKQQCKEAAKALLRKAPCDGEVEPLWFNRAMEKYTDKVVKAISEGINGAVMSSITESTSPSNQSVVVHDGIVCDGCEKSIVGVRYKCGNCCDYDLCEGCEQLSAFIHNEDHAFIKIKRSAMYAGVNRKGKRKPLLKRSVYCVPPVLLMTPQAELVTQTVPDECPTAPEQQPAMIRRSKQKLREELKDVKRHQRHHHHHHHQHQQHQQQYLEPTGMESSDVLIKKSKKQLRRELHEARRGKRIGNERNKDEVCASDKPHPPLTTEDEPMLPIDDTVTATAGTEGTSSTKGHGKCLSSTFIDDTSHPDDSVVYYGTTFTKGWIIENTGTKTWRKVKLVHQNGFQPCEPEMLVPDLEPGQQVELVANYPPVKPQDGVEIKSSWRLIHDGHTPFGDTLWLSIIAQPDPTDELSGTFELITYPSLPISDPEEDDTQIPESMGFSHEDPSSSHISSSTTGGGYTMVDPPTPVLSLASNDSLFQTNDCEEEEVIVEDDDNDIHCASEDEDEFVVVIPDCFKLDVPLTGFNPPIVEPPSPVKETPTDTTDPDNNTSNDRSGTPAANDCINDTEEQNKFKTPPTTPPINDSPNTVRKKGGFFSRETLDAAWTSRSTNPFRYAVGVVNTVADLVDQHVHFSTQKSDETTTTSDCDTSEEQEDVPTNKPSAPPRPTPPQPSAPPLPIPPPADLSDITCQEPDIGRFVNKKWEGPKPPETPMDHLISMGFANRDLNSRLLKKHENNLQMTLQELLDSNGDGYPV